MKEKKGYALDNRVKKTNIKAFETVHAVGDPRFSVRSPILGGYSLLPASTFALPVSVDLRFPCCPRHWCTDDLSKDNCYARSVRLELWLHLERDRFADVPCLSH